MSLTIDAEEGAVSDTGSLIRDEARVVAGMFDQHVFHGQDGVVLTALHFDPVGIARDPVPVLEPLESDRRFSW